MATVVLNNVKKRFGKSQVIHGVSIDIADGEFIVIVGPSGCGKSTLLRMVAGLESVSEGEILIGGERVNEKEPMERNIAMVFQNYALYPHMNVFMNMAFGLKLRKFPKEKIDKRVREVAGILGLSHLLDRKPKALSGGERQRVLIAQALSSEPELLLLDEPTASVDCVVEHELYDLLKRLNQELTIVMSSHNLGVVTRHVSRVLCVNRKVDIHQACELTVDILHEAYASDMAVLRHAATCPVIDPPSSTEHSEHEHSFERRNKDD